MEHFQENQFWIMELEKIIVSLLKMDNDLNWNYDADRDYGWVDGIDDGLSELDAKFQMRCIVLR